MDFHPTQVTGSGPGSDAEEEVWEAFKNTLGPDDNGVVYYRYPVIDKAGDRFDKEPDILLLHEEVGLMVIEVKGYQIHHIDSIEGQTWYLNGTSQDYATPYSQARDQAFFVKSWFDREETLRDDQGRCKIPINFTVALPNISRAEWEEAGFHELPSTPRVLTADDLTPQTLRERLYEEPGDTDQLGTEEMDAGTAVLSGSTVISGSRTPPAPDPTTKGELYEKLITGLKRFDETQETIGSEIPPGPQRIRGIAGSGKTILIAKKAAHLHAKRPEDDIVLTFFTKSLKEELHTLVEHFHYLMTDEEPDWDKLRIIHGWGGKTTDDGLYYNICQEAEFPPRNAGSAKELVVGGADPLKLLEVSCGELVNNGSIPEMYDAILIDEGQDFGKCFYQMCYEALREPENGGKLLIWAYDEAQTLGDLQIPTAREIFGEDADGNPKVDLRGNYENGIQKSRIMRKSYRAPREILMLAHAFGMGIQRADGTTNAITQQDTWEKLGYEVEGDFISDEDTVLTRPDEYSPHPLQHEDEARPFLRFEPTRDKQDEVAFVGEQITRDVEERELNPDDILVIPLGKPSYCKDIGRDVADKLREQGLTPNLTWDGSPDVFDTEGEVTISRINRAKGNEAAMVYLMNTEEVENKEGRFTPLFTRRNQAFVGITRARAWCTLTGLEDTQVATEIGSLVDEITSEQAFTFPASNILEDGEDERPDRTLDEFELLGHT